MPWRDSLDRTTNSGASTRGRQRFFSYVSIFQWCYSNSPYVHWKDRQACDMYVWVRFTVISVSHRCHKPAGHKRPLFYCNFVIENKRKTLFSVEKIGKGFHSTSTVKFPTKYILDSPLSLHRSCAYSRIQNCNDVRMVESLVTQTHLELATFPQFLYFWLINFWIVVSEHAILCTSNNIEVKNLRTKLARNSSRSIGFRVDKSVKPLQGRLSREFFSKQRTSLLFLYKMKSIGDPAVDYIELL